MGVVPIVVVIAKIMKALLAPLPVKIRDVAIVILIIGIAKTYLSFICNYCGVGILPAQISKLGTF